MSSGFAGILSALKSITQIHRLSMFSAIFFGCVALLITGCTLPKTCDEQMNAASRLLVESLGQQGFMEYAGTQGLYAIRVNEGWWQKLHKNERRAVIDALVCANYGPGSNKTKLEIWTMKEGKELFRQD